MNRSLNEIETHAKRAARGAGLSWGMAEEAGRATRWLAAHGLSGPEVLSDVLAQSDQRSLHRVSPPTLGGEWRAPEGDLCPFSAGTALNDCANRLTTGQSVKMGNVAGPLLVVPFAAWAAIHLAAPVQIHWRNCRIVTDGEWIWTDDPDQEIDARRTPALTCHLANAHKETATRPNFRGDVAPEIWEKLDAFAQRTYAPATAASRLLGAGTGLSDND